MLKVIQFENISESRMKLIYNYSQENNTLIRAITFLFVTVLLTRLVLFFYKNAISRFL